MSICYQGETCTLIDHCRYVSDLYQKVHIHNRDSTDEIKTFQLLPSIFSITITRKEIKKRKRKLDHEDILNETKMIEQKYDKFKQENLSEIKLDLLKKYNLIDTSEVRNLASKLTETTVFNLNGVNGGNNSNLALKCEVKKNDFLMPPKCRFYCGCVKTESLKLTANAYDIVIADPPWWNKYIRRLKGADEKLSYSMMYNEEIASIPVKEVLANNSLIAVWCTNAPSNIAAVKELIFPRWGVEYLTTWYWLKLTVDLEPLCEFGAGCQKQPYERVIIGKVGEVKDVPCDLLFASVPSALHSHKPPLLDLLTPYLNCDNPQTLELFARYLLPNTTSVGYEPLKWQHISLFEYLVAYYTEDYSGKTDFSQSFLICSFFSPYFMDWTLWLAAMTTSIM